MHIVTDEEFFKLPNDTMGVTLSSIHVRDNRGITLFRCTDVDIHVELGSFFAHNYYLVFDKSDIDTFRAKLLDFMVDNSMRLL